MESYKSLIKMKMIEAIVAAAVDSVLAVVGMVIFFVSMFADNSFGWGQFFFYTWVLFSMSTLNIIFAVVNFIENKSLKSVDLGLKVFSDIKKKMNILSVSQIAADIVGILAFFIAVIVGLVKWINYGEWETIVVIFIFGGMYELFSIVNLAQNVLSLKKINTIV